MGTIWDDVQPLVGKHLVFGQPTLTQTSAVSEIAQTDISAMTKTRAFFSDNATYDLSLELLR
jgi:hypothetical protein